MHVQSDDDRYEYAESDHEVVKQPQVAEENVRQLRDRLTAKQTDFYGCPVMYIAEKLPNDINEAMKSEKKELWKEAMLDEMNSLHENNTWVLVEKPEKQKVINSK